MLRRLLIANRGEIARRIIRTAKRLGVETVAIYSEVDARAWFVEEADYAVPLGGQSAAESYLDREKVLRAARHSGADAIHPGYGFLSENADFARACVAANLIFVGPDAAVMDKLGAKDDAKALAQSADVPVVPGYGGADQDEPALLKAAADIGFPLLIKATAGGGGKGMRRVDERKHFSESLTAAKREAASAFGNDRVILEKLIDRPRHIEVQVLGDHHDNVVHLFERDCSAQRRHQKVIEEAPAAHLDESTRRSLGEAAVRLASTAGYHGAGTVEFLLDADNRYYFIEMNTRLQVEHPVTEAITGIDLVEWQLRIASGEPLPWQQHDIRRSGAAVEARVYAEDPGNDFLPAAGAIDALAFTEDVRIDTGVRTGDHVSIYYDPMIAKVIAYGHDRAAALGKLRSALAKTFVGGLTTNLHFLQTLLSDEAFVQGTLDTRYLDRHLDRLTDAPAAPPDHLLAACACAYLLAQEREAIAASRTTADPWSPWAIRDGWRPGHAGRRVLELDFGGHVQTLDAYGYDGRYRLRWDEFDEHVAASTTDDGRLQVHARGLARTYQAARVGPWYHVAGQRRGVAFRAQDPYAFSGEVAGSGNEITAPMPGKILQVLVTPGDAVSAEQTLVIIEAMKMELSLRSPRDGAVATVSVESGDLVVGDQQLVTLAEDSQ